MRKDICNQIKTIIPQDELYQFLLLEEIKKIQHLSDLVEIIIGIELFKTQINSEKSFLFPIKILEEITENE